MKLEHCDVVVVAGAGISVASGLPKFNEIRDAALNSVGLTNYLDESDPDRSLSAAMAPEPFLEALEQAGIDVARWLEALLGDAEPTSVHRTIAHHLHLDGMSFTVNFDHLIEAAGTDIPVVAWPDQPSGAKQGTLFKPHGTLGRELIATTDAVLAPLSPPWVETLREAVERRVVVFVGYSGRDFDLSAHWDELLLQAEKVVFFAFDEEAIATVNRMLPRSLAAGIVEVPTANNEAEAGNPSLKFLRWWEESRLELPDGVSSCEQTQHPGRQLFGPDLDGNRELARQHLLASLGDWRSVRRMLINRTLKSTVRLSVGQAAKSAKEAAALQIAHGGRTTAIGLRTVWRLTPPIGRFQSFRVTAHRRETTIWANSGESQRVVANTERWQDQPSILALRASAVKFIGNLAEAVDLAERALARAKQEQHPFRISFAAIQLMITTIWMGDFDRAETVWKSELQPAATITDGRQVSWNAFLEGSLRLNQFNETRSTGLSKATEAFANAEHFFAVGGNIDGVVASQLGTASVALFNGDTKRAQIELAKIDSGVHPSGLYLTESAQSRLDAIAITHGELARVTGDSETSIHYFTKAANSPLPLQQLNGLLGLVLNATGTQQLQLTRQCRQLASRINADGHLRLLADPDRLTSATTRPVLFF